METTNPLAFLDAFPTANSTPPAMEEPDFQVELDDPSYVAPKPGEVFISSSGICKGFGTDKYKWVAYLSNEDRKAIRIGAICLINSGRKSGGNHGTTWRMVVEYKPGRYCHRVPSKEVLASQGLE